MDEKQINQFIGYAVVAICAYYILQMILPFLFVGLVCVVIWHLFNLNQRK